MELHQQFDELPNGWAPPQRRLSLIRRVVNAARDRWNSVADRVYLPQEEAADGAMDRVAAATPPWLVSLCIHMVMMIVVGLLAIEAHSRVEESMSVELDLTTPFDDSEVFAETLGEQLDDPTMTTTTPLGEALPEEASAAWSASELPPVENPLAGPKKLDLPSGGLLPAGTEEVPDIGMALTGREPGMKKALLRAYGGTATTEQSVEEGLRWLTRRQQRSGMWSLVGPYKDGANTENEEAATAMAILAYQGAGYTPQSSDDRGFQRPVTRAWQALLRRQQPDGRFFGDVAPAHRLYTQAQCSIAVCELFAMTRDEKYRKPAQLAIDYCVQIQAPEGGWRYQPGVDSDMSVTGWFVMALQSARMAGLEVPSPTLERVGEFLDTVAREGGSQYGYLPKDGAKLSLSAEGLLCRQYLGWKHNDERLRRGVDHLLANLPRWDERNVYYWYYATQVCHHMEGGDWQKWNGVTRQLIPEHQERRGQDRGSWNPNGDRWGSAGGRLYVTCMSMYILEVYYRHLALYQNGLLD